MKISCSSFSDCGLVRKENQDSVLCDAERRLYAVADGMGGGSEGARASAIVCSHLSSIPADADFAVRVVAVGEAVAAANREIFNYSKSKGFKQMGTTVALVMFGDGETDRASICHVGDSRVYRLRDGELDVLTRDHSVGAELALALGGMRSGVPYADKRNPLSHMLTRAVGTERSVACEWSRIDIKVGDRFLVCSDGVHGVLSDDETRRLLARGDSAAATKALAEAVHANGAPDNYSVLVVTVER